MKPQTFATFVPGAAGLGNFWSPVIDCLPAECSTPV